MHCGVYDFINPQALSSTLTALDKIHRLQSAWRQLLLLVPETSHTYKWYNPTATKSIQSSQIMCQEWNVLYLRF